MSESSDTYLIFGDDDYLVEEGLRRVISQIRSEGFDDLTVEIVDCKEQGTGDVMAEIASPSLFSVNKATVLKRFQLAGSSTLASQLDACVTGGLAPGQFLILMPQKVDKRLKIVKAIRKKGGLIELGALDHDGLVKWIVGRFKEEGKSASPEVAESLLDLKGEVDTKGQTMRALDSEIEKLVVYSGDAKKITRADVEAVVGRSRTEKVFELIELVALKRVREAIETVADLIETGESPIGIVFLISREIRWLIQIRLFLSSERVRWDADMRFPAFRSTVLPKFKAWTEARGIPPEATFLRQNPYAAYFKFKRVEGFDLDDLMKLLDRLLEANTLLVSTSMKSQIVLDRFVTTLGV